MPDPTYKSILKSYRKIVRELQQQIRDINYWNGLPQAHGHVMDVEDLRIALHHARRAMKFWKDGQTVEAGQEWQHVMAALADR